MGGRRFLTWLTRALRFWFRGLEELRGTTRQSGCCFLRWAFKWPCAHQRRGRQRRHWLAPVQLHQHAYGKALFRGALWANGFAILRTDFRKGFNEISRQAILGAVQLGRCPQLMSLFNLFNTCDGACFFNYRW